MTPLKECWRRERDSVVGPGFIALAQSAGTEAGTIRQESQFFSPTGFPVTLLELGNAIANTDPSPVTRWRRQRQDFVRVEIQVRKEDAALVRDVGTALVDPERETETRTILRERIAGPCAGGFKTLLASAPLEGIDLERPRDVGRDAAP